MKRENITIRSWMSQATPEQKKQLAKAARTSVMHLWHIAKGRRRIMPELAQRIAHGSTQVDGDMPVLDQRMLCEICAHCPIAK